MRVKFDVDLNINLTVKGENQSEVLNLLEKIIKQNNKTMSALSDLKDKLALSDQKIDVLTTATEGLTDDVAHLKELISNNPDGIDAAGVAELNTIVEAQNTKLTELGTKLTDLDSQTTRPEEPTEPTEPEA